MSVLAPGRNIVLIGLMGAGKTTVGALVARRLGRPFVDTDALVEREAGRSISAIFAGEGERGFRRREAAAIRQVAALRGQVVAVGGGAVLDPDNVTQLRGTGDLLLLDAEAATLADRLADTSGRPLLDAADAASVAQTLDELRTARDAAYAAAASAVIDTDGRDPEQIASDIVEWARATPGLLTADEGE